MAFITPQGIKALKQYKYVSGGYSPLDNVFNYWWEFFVKLMPRNVAPNLLTLTGLFLTIIACVIYLPYDTTFKSKMPNWMYHLSAFLCFMYQTFDAIDGKHARNTKSSSPLGQLFDHGCDALCVTFSFVLMMQISLAGYCMYVPLALGWSVMTTFYFS